MYDYERLGVFYLGRGSDPTSGEQQPGPLLYDSRDLTTHAVIVGMTGSGKTGLGVTFLEEAGIDGIPAIVIDPKGDMGNLALTFPQLRGADLEPWVEPREAQRNGQSIPEFAQGQADLWRQGLDDWDQSPERIALFRSACDVTLYTPGSSAGRPLTILKSLQAPPSAVIEQSELFRDQISATVAGLLTLLGVDADPLRSREHILLSHLVERAWREGRDLDLPQLIREIQNPGISQIGVLDLESIFPVNDRLGLSLQFNNVLASPAFAGWTQGEPLDINRLLYTADGRPRLAVVSIAHLSDRERMFFVTLLLNEVISWMRRQSGTSSLRAILYMDEVFGYLPPTANPPSKIPLLTLMKQARAYGVGVILATQNPVDLDYKALSNAGTWCLGRLQTERDKLRVLDGLESVCQTSGQGFNRAEMDRTLSSLRKRQFVLQNAHDERPEVFQTRWALSYLRGPLTREQIQLLSGTATHPRQTPSSQPPRPGVDGRGNATAPQVETSPQRSVSPPPVISPEIRQRHVPLSGRITDAAEIEYRAGLFAAAQSHHVDVKAKVDVWRTTAYFVPVDENGLADWAAAEVWTPRQYPDAEPLAGASFSPPPSACQRPASYKSWTSAFKTFLHQSCVLPLLHAPDLKVYSRPHEQGGEFRGRLTLEAREARDLLKAKLTKKHESRIAQLKERLRKAQQRTEQERQQANSAATSAMMTFGTSVLGAFFGRKALSATNASKAATTMRAARRAVDQRSDIARAEQNSQAIEDELKQLESEVAREMDSIKDAYTADQLRVEDYPVSARKSDLNVLEVSLCWRPYRVSERGAAAPAYDEDQFSALPDNA